MLVPFKKRGTISNLGPFIQFVKPLTFVFRKLDAFVLLFQQLFNSCKITNFLLQSRAF